MRLFRLLVAALVLLVGSMGCTLARASSTMQISVSPTPGSTLTATIDSRWENIADGVWRRMMNVEPPYTRSAFAMPVLRFDPQQVMFRAHYVPDKWDTIEGWAAFLDDPIVVVNASFFREDGSPLGLVISDGQVFGRTLRGYGGMLQVERDMVRIRSLVQEAYRGESYEQAVQGFPLLVEQGGQQARTDRGFDEPARRTMIAQDMDGFIYIMVAPDLTSAFTLRNAQQWLLDSELNIDVAFNLDGGRSSGLYIDGRGGDHAYPAISLIPVVLAVYPR